MKPREILIALNEKYKGNWENVFTAMTNHEKLSEDDLYNLLLNVNPDNFITILDEDYPEELRKIYRPPFVLYKNDLDDYLRMYNFCKPFFTGGDIGGD